MKAYFSLLIAALVCFAAHTDGQLLSGVDIDDEDSQSRYPKQHLR